MSYIQHSHSECPLFERIDDNNGVCKAVGYYMYDRIVKSYDPDCTHIRRLMYLHHMNKKAKKKRLDNQQVK